jgi:hypothetical protein
MRALAFALPLALAAAAASADEQAFDGWIVGAPCADRLQVADCPLKFVDRPVFLLENGEKLALVHGEGRTVGPAEIDKVYARKVRLTGEVKDGVLAPVRLDELEKSADKGFFKGCL